MDFKDKTFKSDLLPRPPYVTESAADYYYDVICPFFKNATVGYHYNNPMKNGYCSSSTSLHWFQEPKDEYAVLMIEKIVKD